MYNVCGSHSRIARAPVGKDYETILNKRDNVMTANRTQKAVMTYEYECSNFNQELPQRRTRTPSTRAVSSSAWISLSLRTMGSNVRYHRGTVYVGIDDG